MDTNRKERLRQAVRFFYDLQKLRIQTGNRSTTDTVELTEPDQDFMVHAGDDLNELEKAAFKEIASLLKGIPIYENWLKQQKGCGPTLSGVIISEIDMCRKVDVPKDAVITEPWKVDGFEYFKVQYTETIQRINGTTVDVDRDLLCFKRGEEIWHDCCPTASSLWAYCGLHVNQETGKSVQRTKGQRANWNPMLKTKLVGVLTDCIYKHDGTLRSKAMTAAIAREYGDDYLGSEKYHKDMKKIDPTYKKNKKRFYPNVTAASKKLIVEAHNIGYEDLWHREKWPVLSDNYKHRKQTMRVTKCMACKGSGKVSNKKCNNCEGTGGPAPWGASAAHRHNAAKRYMVKMFLLDLWKEWREVEKLPVRVPYAEEYVGKVHHTGPASTSVN